MIKNFDEIKKQLKELSPILNSFKSESVQLKIVELILEGGVPEIEKEHGSGNEKPKPKSRGKGTQKKAEKKAMETKTKKKSLKGRSGPATILRELIDDNYFKSKHTIKDIVEYCSTHKARKIKQSDFSGVLARFVKENTLKRTKNKDNQYEYFKN